MNHRRFRSPLVFDAEKFSKKCKIPTKFNVNINPTTLGFILKAVYIYLLMSINLLLFASSGNLIVFYDSIIPTAEVCVLLLFLLIFSFSLIGVCYKKPLIQNIICCVFTFLFVTALFNQFYQLDANAILGNYFSKHIGSITPVFLFKGSHIVISLMASALLFYLMYKFEDKFMIVYVAIFFIIFIGVLQKDSLYQKHAHEFTELYSSQMNVSNDKDDKRFIYIMLPNFSSYKTLAMIKSPQAAYAYKLITGFYAKNNFEIYPNSFIEYSNQFINITQSVNAFSNKTPNEHMLNTMLLYRYWNFFNVNDEYVFLSNNQMFDSFRKAGYKISAYKSRGIDLCRKNHKFNVDRCIEKINFPVNLQNSGMSVMGRTQLLFAEWFFSMRLVNRGPLNNIIKLFLDTENMPLFRINYNNLYVINSIKTFDILADNIISDTGRNAYFVYADIPSDMFIYDEFCNIKNRNNWISKDDFPWMKNNNISLKQTAYIDQTKCLYGKLQDFIDKLNKNNILDNSVLIINGLSSNHNFDNNSFENVIDQFIYDNMVITAIKSPSIKNFKVNEDICSSKSIVRNTLYNIDENIGCDLIDNMGIRGKVKDNITNIIMSAKFSQIDTDLNIKKFEAWYDMWKSINSIGNQEIDMIKKEKDLFNSVIDDEIPELENNTLQ